MAIDVLTYNALQENNQELKQELADLTEQVDTISGGGGGGSPSGADPNTLAIVEYSSMLQANQWCRIPENPTEGSWTNGFKVCDATGYYRCGCNCTWTVPSGTTCVRFQMWGAGGGTTESRCCMFSPVGDTGAYQSVIMPVTAGNSYTMCAGCAHCCYAGSDGYNQQRGNPSYIQGTGLTNFCVEGGWSSCIYKQICDRNDQYFPSKGISCCCNWLNGCICRSGATVCSGDWETPGIGYPDGYYATYMPWLACQVCALGSATTGDIWRIRGQSSMAQHDWAYPMRWYSATVYGYPQYCCGRGGCYICNSCGGHCQSAWPVGIRPMPGTGGWGTSSCGGNCTCGDSGRMGMICVCYN